MKKFLVSAAAIAALATSAMAYDLYPKNSNDLEQMDYNTSSISSELNKAVAEENTGLIFPAYFVGNGWESTIKVVNTSNFPVVAKVVFYDAKDSHEVRDFNIYLSGNDVWTGTIKVDDDGVAKIISTDDSAPLEMKNNEYKMASADEPMKGKITSNKGYIEVIPMVQADTDAHGVSLRKAYIDFSYHERLVEGKTKNDVVFKNGVVQNNVVYTPYMKLDINATYDIDGDGKNGEHFKAVKAGALDGYIRITDTVKGKDMIHKPVYVKFDTNTSGNMYGLVYLEGEKANLADVTLENNGIDNKYDLAKLDEAVESLSVSKAYITFGEASLNNMYALVTSPLKRVYVQQALMDNNTSAKAFEGYKLNKDGNDVESYGYVTLVAQIFDNNENMASASQFSPANTPTIKLYNEISSTGNDVNNDNHLAHYISQAGYSEGYAYVTRSGGNGVIPGIVTQMIATQAGGKVVTNWFDPVTR